MKQKTAKQMLGGVPIRTIPVEEMSRFSNKYAAIIEKFFVNNRDKLVYLHLFMFLFFLMIIVAPVYTIDPDEESTIFDNLQMFSNYALWGLWFPLVFLSVIFTGRSWCGLLCPMGAGSEWGNKIGFQLAIPKWLRWEGVPIVSFLVVTIWGQTVGVRDHPESALLVFGGTMLLAIIIGVLFGRSKRAWCRHMCPIGLLLGVFSRLGAVDFAPKKRREGGDRQTERGLCPTMIDINRKEESRHCIECFRCINPEARGGLFLRLRRPGEEIEKIRKANPNIAEVWFFFLGIGVALGGFLWLVLPQYQTGRQQLGEWFVDNGIFWVFESGPAWLMSVHPERREVFYWLDFISIVGFMVGFMILIGALLWLTTSLAAWLSGRFGGDSSYRDRFIELGYQYAPIAIISLIVGLGAKLFDLLTVFGVSPFFIQNIKLTIFAISFLWSLWLAWNILKNQGVAKRVRYIPMLPGAIGSLLVGVAWWPSIFGM